MINYLRTKIKNQKIRLQEWRDYYLFKKYSRKALVPFDANWFKGKRVAIIGGADSAYKEKLGEYIDSFDVVVRINNGVRVIDKYHEYVGRRTDFLFHTLYENIEGGGSPIEIDLWKEKEVKNIVFSHHLQSEYGSMLHDFIIKYLGFERIVQLDLISHLKNMELIAPYHPTTGIIAINTILSCKPSLIYVTGITFFRTGHHQDYRKGDLNHWMNKMRGKDSRHDPDEEYRAFKILYGQHTSIFELDTTLQQIMDNDHE